MNSDTPQKDELTSLLDQPVLVRFKKNNQQTFYAVLTDEAKHKLRSLLIRERIDELKNLGFDRRLDNPILYCGPEDNIGIDERIAALEAELEREEDV